MGGTELLARKGRLLLGILVVAGAASVAAGATIAAASSGRSPDRFVGESAVPSGNRAGSASPPVSAVSGATIDAPAVGSAEKEPPTPTVAPGSCDVVVYTPPQARTAQSGELCVPRHPVGTTVVLVHGGGGYEGDRSQTDAWRNVHLEAGRSTFAIDYALLDPDAARDATRDGALWPRPEQNVKAAVQFVRRDTTLADDEVVVHGFSAGARLAGIAATTAGHPVFAGGELWPDVSDAVDGAVLFYGYYDGSQFSSDAYYGGAIPAGAAAVEEIDTGDPWLLIVHGAADTLVPADQSIALAAAAEAAGTGVELVLVDDASHGFDGYGLTALTALGRLLVADIDANLGPRSSDL